MALDSCKSDDKTKQNNSELVVAIPRMKRYLPLVSKHHPEPMIGLADIELC